MYLASGTKTPGVYLKGWAITILLSTSDGNWSVAVVQRDADNQLKLSFATYSIQ